MRGQNGYAIIIKNLSCEWDLGCAIA